MRFPYINHCKHKTVCKLATRFAPYVTTFLLLCVCVVPITTEAAQQTSTNWQLSPSSSAGDGSLTLTIRAENEVRGWMKTSVPILTIHCDKGNAALYVETGMALEVSYVDMQYVRLQLDDNKPYAQKWHEATNATVSARDASTLIKQLTQSKNFIFEFTPFNSPPARAEFTVAGLSAYLPQLTNSCW